MTHDTNIPIPAQLPPDSLFVMTAHKAARSSMLELTAVTAIKQPVHVIDGGNHFNLYTVSKHIRRRTVQLKQSLANIQVSRAFNCYQMLAMLEKLDGLPQYPVIIIDLLFTFYDEDISLQESERVLTLALKALRRRAQFAPVLVSVRPSWRNEERNCLLAKLKDAADVVADQQVEQQLTPGQAVQPLGLFPAVDETERMKGGQHG